jgi:hypothetical protein
VSLAFLLIQFVFEAFLSAIFGEFFPTVAMGRAGGIPGNEVSLRCGLGMWSISLMEVDDVVQDCDDGIGEGKTCRQMK